MKTLSIAYYHLLTNLRDRKSTMVQIFAPLLLIFILGNALGGLSSDNSLELSLGIYSENQSEVSIGLVNYLNEAAKELELDTKTVTSIEALEALIIDNDIDAGIIIDTDNDIEVLSGPSNGIKSNIVFKLIESFDNMIISETIIGINDLDSFRSTSTKINENYIDFEGEIPTAIDYYAITMLAMFMMYGAGYGAYAIRSDYKEIRGQRIQTTTVRFYEHFTGLALGTIATVLLQGLAVVIFSKFVFGVNFGDSFWSILFFVTTFAILATGLGMFVALLFKDKDQGSNIINIMIPIFTLISGGFTAIDAQGALKTAQFLTPNYHFHEVMLNYVFNISSDVVVSSLTTLWVMIAVCYSGAIILKGRTL